MNTKARRVSFKGAHGLSLDARLQTPADVEPSAYALLAHCFSCSKDLTALVRLSKHLAAKGIAVLRFDFTGLGNSEGDFANTNFSSNVEDLVAAADFLRAEFAAPTLLIGHSFGGTAVLKAAPQIPEVRGVCTIAAPFDPAHILDSIRVDIDAVEAQGVATVNIGGRPFQIQRQFLDDVRDAQLAEDIAAFDGGLLVMHSPQDRVIDIRNAEQIFEAASYPKSFVTLDGASHLLRGAEHGQFAGEMLATWADLYIDRAQPAEATGEDSEPDTVLVEQTDEGLYVNRVVLGRHQFWVDEPLSMGGDDAGPDPYGLVCAALGACTSMTLRMYADRKEWPLEHVQVKVRHAKVSADGAADNKRGAQVDKFSREIRLRGDLDAAQRARLVEIANRCPVHRTLTRENIIETELLEFPDAQ